MEENKPKETEKRPNESLLAWLLVFFLIFEVILVTVVLVRSFRDAKAPVTEPPTEETTEKKEEETEPKPSIPVFAGGALATKPAVTEHTQTPEGLSSKHAVLVNAQTGEILASAEGDVRFAPASMTKVMTLIVACEQLSQDDLNRRIPYTQEIFDYTSSGHYKGTEPLLGGGVGNYTKYLGDEFRIEDLLYGIGVASSAECTYMICRDVSGSEEAFVALMNQKVQEMGLTETHFDNAIGYESANNYTTASDMAAIMTYALQCDLIRNILSQKTIYTYRAYYKENGVEKSYGRQFNATLGDRLSTYQTTFGSAFSCTGVTLQGGKTGYLKENGVVNNCLVAWAASKTDGALYVVVLGCNESTSAYTMKDVKALLDTYVP